MYGIMKLQDKIKRSSAKNMHDLRLIEVNAKGVNAEDLTVGSA